ncbi:MAG: oxygen-dependent coproporphyrinogen oxidase [Bacteriovoracaceae bacterium]
MEKLKEEFHQYVCDLQDQIVRKMQDLDPEIELIEDFWNRTDFGGNPGGGGRTRALRGKIFENAGVNTSCVFGEISPEFAKSIGATKAEMWAAGISLIIHPYNPRVPTVHANFRMIMGGDKFWFGGGADLTPYYPNVEDFHYFHEVWKDACAPYGCYDDMKKQCDEYFVNHHRGGEMRGVGGIFFDHFNSGDTSKDFEMVKHLGNHFIKSYFPIVEKRMNEAYDDEDVDFQLHRRGRYVEFNLIHDRGTTFGLKSGGRTESILISLPGRVKYSYGYSPKDQGPHSKMMEYYRPQSYV